MKYSQLKNDLEILALQYKHEMALLKMKYEQAERELLSKCTHAYDDDTSARVFAGTQWDNWHECDICGKSV
jgi:hypothetical protein